MRSRLFCCTGCIPWSSSTTTTTIRMAMMLFFWRLSSNNNNYYPGVYGLATECSIPRPTSPIPNMKAQALQLPFGKHSIYYEQYTPTTTSTATRTKESSSSEQSILFLNGFGVGAFHQHRLIHEMTLMEEDIQKNSQQKYNNMYAMDYLGQGQSWPTDCDDGNSPNEQNLQYSGQLWVDQTIQLLEHIISTNDNSDDHKVHLVGNSLGGHLAVHIAAQRPDLVASIVLLNATPVWGLNLPGWSGALPAPFPAKQVGRFLFDQIRKVDTIQQYLEAAYADPAAFENDDNGSLLVPSIRACTETAGGHAAFASILWSPPINGNNDDNSNPSPKPFDAALSRVACDALLCFGDQDPWCTPPFAAQMLEVLESRKSNKKQRTEYVELSNVGHCPNHEAPKAVATLLTQWLQVQRGDENWQQPVLAQPRSISEAWGITHVMTPKKKDEIRMTWLDRLAVTFV